MPKIKVADIIVPEDRMRQHFQHVEDLAHSISNIGLLNPLTITRDNRLVAGERRLKAIKLLQWEEVDCRYTDQEDPAYISLIELEENIRREEMTWQEQCRGIRKVHLMMCDMHGRARPGPSVGDTGWTLQDTADMFNLSKTSISKVISLADAIDVYPHIEDCKTKEVALSMLKRLKRLAVQERIAKTVKNPEVVTAGYDFVCGDAIEIIKGLPDESIDLYVFDPPWGVDSTGERGSSPGYATAGSIYDDSAEPTFKLLEALTPEMARTLKRDRHFYMISVIEHYTRFMEILRGSFTVDAIPIMWVFPGMNPAVSKVRWPCQYSAIYHCWKGVRELKGVSGNVINIPRVPGKDRIHPHQRPQKLYEVLILPSTNAGETICDPCCGSGVAARAARACGVKALCIDQDPGVVAAAKSHFLVTAKQFKVDQDVQPQS